MFDFLDILKEVGDDIRNSFQDEETVTLTLAKPFCSPARSIIVRTLEKYGVKLYSLEEKVNRISLADFARRMRIEIKTFENLRYGPGAIVLLPISVEAKIRVKVKQAAWAEYLLLRTGQLYVPGKYFEPKNEQWALRHGGVMPPSWKEKPWIERSCSEGHGPWDQVRKAYNRSTRKRT